MITIFKIIIAIFLLAALIYYGVIDVGAMFLLVTQKDVLLVALPFLCIGYIISATRWFLIIRALDIAIEFRKCFEIYSIGGFANTFLPGGIGGDALRIIYVAHLSHGNRIKAALSVIIDRVLATSVLFSLAFVFSFIAPVYAKNSVTAQSLHYTLLALLVGLFLTFLFLLIFSKDNFIKVFENYVGNETFLRRVFLQILMIPNYLRKRPFIISLCIVLSVLVTVTILISVQILSRTYYGGGLENNDFYYITIISLAANIFPLTPGGIGVGEAAFSALCKIWEVTNSGLSYGSIFLGYRILATLINLVGIIAFFTHKNEIIQLDKESVILDE